MFFLWCCTLWNSCLSSLPQAEKAGAISLQQLALATGMEDPLLAAQCRMFAAYSLLQRGRLKEASKIIRWTCSRCCWLVALSHECLWFEDGYILFLYQSCKLKIGINRPTAAIKLCIPVVNTTHDWWCGHYHVSILIPCGLYWACTCTCIYMYNALVHWSTCTCRFRHLLARVHVVQAFTGYSRFTFTLPMEECPYFTNIFHTCHYSQLLNQPKYNIHVQYMYMYVWNPLITCSPSEHSLKFTVILMFKRISLLVRWTSHNCSVLPGTT